MVGSWSTDDNEQIDFTVPVPGPYYILVSYWDAGNSYDLVWAVQADDGYEENDARGWLLLAATIPLAYLASDGDVPWVLRCAIWIPPLALMLAQAVRRRQRG